MVSQDNNSMQLRPRVISMFKDSLFQKKKSHCKSQQHCGRAIKNWYFVWISRLRVTGHRGFKQIPHPKKGCSPASLSSARGRQGWKLSLITNICPSSSPMWNTLSLIADNSHSLFKLTWNPAERAALAPLSCFSVPVCCLAFVPALPDPEVILKWKRVSLFVRSPYAEATGSLVLTQGSNWKPAVRGTGVGSNSLLDQCKPICETSSDHLLHGETFCACENLESV